MVDVDSDGIIGSFEVQKIVSAFGKHVTEAELRRACGNYAGKNLCILSTEQ